MISNLNLKQVSPAGLILKKFRSAFPYKRMIIKEQTILMGV